jgi:hypothetical protein
MAKVYADAAGVLLRISADEFQESVHGGAPPGTVTTLAFDEDTNNALIRDVIESFSAYRVIGGALQKNGVPAAIAGPGSHYAARQQLQAAKQTIANNAVGLQTYHDAATVTNAQTVLAVKSLIEDVQAIVVILRGLIKEAN